MKFGQGQRETDRSRVRFTRHTIRRKPIMIAAWPIRLGRK